MGRGDKSVQGSGGTGAAPVPAKAAMAWVAVLTLAALALRAYLATRSGLWRDEALFLFITRMDTVGEMLSFLRLHESHPPLFYLLMRGWSALFGRSDTSALALPVILGAALVPAIYRVGATLFSERTGLVAAVLAAVSPALAQRSALVRPYSLLPLLCLLSTGFLWRGLRGGDRRAWPLYVLTTAGLVYTHNWGWLAVIAQWIAVGVALGVAAPRPRAAVVREWLAAQVALFALYAPWMPTLLYQIEHAGHGPRAFQFTLMPLLHLAGVATLEPGMEGHELAGGYSPMAVAGALILASFIAAAFARARQTEERGALLPALLLVTAVPVAAVLVGVVASTASNLLLARTVTTVTPLLLLAMARGIVAVGEGGRPLVSAGAAGAIAVAFLVAALMPGTDIKSNARELAAQVAAQARPDDLVVVTPEWLASSFNLYFAPGNEQIDYPQLARVGATPYNDLPRRYADPEPFRRIVERLRQARSQGRRVWLIMHREHRDIDYAPEMEELTPEVMAEGIGRITLIRSNQIRRTLTELYGPPDETTVPRDPRYGDENLVALLYRP